jgi:hypothetical protein
MKVQRFCQASNCSEDAKDFKGWVALPNTTIPIIGDCLVNQNFFPRCTPTKGDFASADMARKCNQSVKDRFLQGDQETNPWVLYRPRRNCWGLVEGKETKLKTGDVVMHAKSSDPDDIFEGKDTGGFVVSGYANRTLSWLGTIHPGASVWRLVTNGDAPAKPSIFRLPGNRIFSQPIPLP